MLKKVLITATAVLALATSASAAELKEFRVGILGGENQTDRLRNYSCLADHLKKTLGVDEVKLFPAADYDGVIQGLLGGTLDFAELGASGYAKTYLANPEAVDPVLTTVQTDGSAGYHSVLVARKDSGFKSLEDLKGKKLGFADPDSTSGYLVPTVALPKDLGMPVDKFFGSTGFGGGHEQVVLGVMKGTFDGAVTWASGVGDFEDGYTSGNLRKMVDKGELDMNDLVQLWESPLIPNGPVVLRHSLDDATKQKIVDMLIGMSENDKDCFSAVEGGNYKGYTKVTPKFYETIIAARKKTIGG